MKPDDGWGIANPGSLAGWLATHIWVGSSTIFRGKQLAASYGPSRLAVARGLTWRSSRSRAPPGRNPGRRGYWRASAGRRSNGFGRQWRHTRKKFASAGPEVE
eukprot:3896919-Prymnesium_polylepis.1